MRDGVALVITLILLSVTLVMAVAFLAISRRERGSVSTETDTATAKFAADAAFANAEAQIVSDILTTTNPFIEHLYVSTNYVSNAGFFSGNANVTNVNYNGYPGGGALSPADFVLNIANLFYNPRPPVFYSNDFRFYLDLNRNGLYDTNGWVTNLDDKGQGLGTVSWQVGDPEWIGVLEHPDAPHGPNNPFIARYCFIAVPANSLDLNHIHNQALDLNRNNGNTPVIPATPSPDGYNRNQGVGTWEINLAAFLTDLNTNSWDPGSGNLFGLPAEPYQYPELLGGNSMAFDDARALVAWRYGGVNANYDSLSNADSVFGNQGGSYFINNGIDGYDLGQQKTFDTNYSQYGNPSYPWVGAYNPNNFFSSPSDLFNPAKSTTQFTNNLQTAGTYKSTYNRYTFYRMLSQLGSDTAPDSGKINVNYQNAVVNYITNNGQVVPSGIVIVANMETNYISWQPQDFFNAAAHQMLQAYTAQWYVSSPSNYMQTYYGLTERYFTNMDGINITNITNPDEPRQIPSFGVENIPVYVNNRFVYTPAINRVLQLAANIYDSTTNRMDPNATLGLGGTVGISNYPSVFRPVLFVTNEFSLALNTTVTNVYIRGYQYIPYATNGINDPMFNMPAEVTDLPVGTFVTNVWGVPWIIGAKKGFPNVNQVELENNFFIERQLKYTRSSVDIAPLGSTFPFGRTYSTNQQFVIGITNLVGAVSWNSYGQPYSKQVNIWARNSLNMGLTWTNPDGNNGSIVNSLLAYTITNIQPWGAGASVMLMGTNQYPFNLTVNGTLAPKSPYLNSNIPFLLNPQNPDWITNAAFVYNYGPNTMSGFVPPCFIPQALDPSNYLDSGLGLIPMPQMTLSMTNRLQVFAVDSAGGILDYVQLGGMNNSVSINKAVADNSYGDTQAYQQGLWSTNYFTGTSIPFGVVQQYYVNQAGGTIPGPDSDNPWPANMANLTSRASQQAFFTAFFQASDTYGTTSNFQFSVQAPFSAIRTVVQRFVYAANDPLVHYMTSDLNDFGSVSNSLVEDSPPLKKLFSGSDRYMAWGNPALAGGKANQLPASYIYGDPFGAYPPQQTRTDYANHYNLAYKDPMVVYPDNWDFPTNVFPNIGWLGRVHRGTPWQTVFLKSSDVLKVTNTFSQYVGQATWSAWTGNGNSYDAMNAAPVQDRLLFDLFTTAPNDDAGRGRLSVNVGADDLYNPMTGLAAWSGLLSGIPTFTNNALDVTLQFITHYQNPMPGQAGPSNAVLFVQPLGSPPYPGGNIALSPMWQIVQNINSTRTNFVALDGLHGVFEHVGDVLSATALSDASPYLHVLNNGAPDASQMNNGITDEMYEWLPQQIMSLLDITGTPQSPPRYVIYCYGQTLKPADNGIVNSGTYFGMCTNYQVVAESAARVVLRVVNTPTPENPNATPHVIIEQYNPLPPD